MGKWGLAGKRGSRKQECGEAGKQDRHVHPLLMRCPGVSKDDGCLSEGNHKSLSLPQVWSPARAKDMPFGKMCRGEGNK